MGTEADLTYLKQEKIFEHLGAIVSRVVDQKPADAHSLVEVLSRLIKESSNGANAAAAEDTGLEQRAAYVQKARKIDEVPSDESGPIAVCALPDVMEEAEMLSWAGVGFGEVEAYKVKCSLRALAAKEKDNGLTKLRFWGKILGTGGDYYVAEAQKDGGGDAPDPEGEDADMEPSGTGANAYAYYVTVDLCDDWQKLPDIRPREIVAARKIKRLVSGNLSSPVITHPFFPGKEEVLLRAQIAQITADTVLCIKGFLKKEEEEGSPIEDNPEFNLVCPSAAQLLKQENWVHMQPHILRSGRTTHKEVPEEEEGNDEVNNLRAKMLAEIEADPIREDLRSVDKDVYQWVVKQAGDTALYKDLTPGEVKKPPKCSAVTYVRSLKWPGAVTVSRGLQFANLYIGYGLPAGEPEFFPPAPPNVQDEPEERDDQDEPQGTEVEEPTGEEGGEE